MNDRFRFRIWDEETQTMQYNTFCWEESNMMQCTGLKDKNGILIYEGDLIEYQLDRDILRKYGFTYDSNMTEVYTVEYRTIAVFLEGNHHHCDLDASDTFIMFKVLREGRVIGSIYENPELLNKTDK